MASTDELIAKHGEETVRKAFWLQERIFEEGIEGAKFSEYSEENMEDVKKRMVYQSIKSRTQRDF